MRAKISRELRKLYAEKILDLANIGAGALLFGQFLSEDAFSWLAGVAGLAILVVGYVASGRLHTGGDLNK